jgi:hypothetical protein
VKLPLSIILAAAGVPVGIALAEYGSPIAITDPEATDTAQLVADAEQVMDGLGKARAQLEKAAENARAAEDLLLATCLDSKLEELSDLEGKAVPQFRALREAVSAEIGRVPFVVLTVMGQKASLIVEEAALCVGANDDNPGIDFANIAPPVDPNAGIESAPFEPAWPSDGLPGVPAIPPAASPVR